MPVSDPWVSRFHYLQEAQLVLCVLGSKLQSSCLCSKRFTKPPSWPLSLTQTTSLLPAYKMFNSHTNLTHPSRHTPRLEQLPRLCFLFQSSPRTVGIDGYIITSKCSGTLYLFTDGHQRHLMLPGDSWPFPPLTATTSVSVTLVFWKFSSKRSQLGKIKEIYLCINQKLIWIRHSQHHQYGNICKKQSWRHEQVSHQYCQSH